MEIGGRLRGPGEPGDSQPATKITTKTAALEKGAVLVVYMELFRDKALILRGML